MNKQEQLALIKTYLADETKLYQDWYKGLEQGELEMLLRETEKDRGQMKKPSILVAIPQKK